MSWLRTLLIAALIVAAGYGGMVVLRHAMRPETRLEAAACWFEKPALRNTECYRLTVPESRGTNSSRTVTLPVVILRSPSTPAEEPPVLHLAGGPGQPAGLETTAELASWADYLNRMEWARDRDHIIVDTRGVGGRADPRLRCAILSDMGWVLRVDRLKHDPRAYDAAVRAGVEGCRRTLADKGINLAAYNSTAAAQDLIDLRHALKLPSWTIYGVSYGARLGLELMRRDPKGVHAAVLGFRAAARRADAGRAGAQSGTRAGPDGGRLRRRRDLRRRLSGPAPGRGALGAADAREAAGADPDPAGRQAGP